MVIRQQKPPHTAHVVDAHGEGALVLGKAQENTLPPLRSTTRLEFRGSSVKILTIATLPPPGIFP